MIAFFIKVITLYHANIYGEATYAGHGGFLWNMYKSTANILNRVQY